ncbi:MAG: rRNA methyltransferase, partial [Chitinophagaceae bacterium]
MPFTLPPAFSSRMQAQLGSEYSRYEQALQQPAPVSIRINKSKVAELPNLERVPWCSTGFYLPERPFFTIDPLLHASAYYVQEASSMFLEQAFLQATEHKSALRVLDLCGAPGGKSTLLASLISKESLLISNEVIRSRAQILAENIQKWGAPNV